jgi:heat shock protein HslJ
VKYRVFVVATVVLGISTLVSCSGSDDSSSDSSTKTPLVGTNWVLTDQTSIGAPLTGVTVSARFGSDNRVTGENGCNSYFGPYQVTGSRITIGPNLGTTLVGCDGAAGAVERAYMALLPQVSSFSIRGTTLSLSGNGKTLLTYRASIGADELRGSWTATGYYSGTAIRSAIIGSTLTANFDKTTVSGDAGCNIFSGPYTTNGDAIAIGPLASTLRACSDADVETQEQQYLAALQLAKTYRVTGTRLELFREGGTIAATFERSK